MPPIQSTEYQYIKQPQLHFKLLYIKKARRRALYMSYALNKKQGNPDTNSRRAYEPAIKKVSVMGDGT